jgi:hypothetical protein
MFLTSNEIPINRHLDAIIDKWHSIPEIPSDTSEARALARAERVALHYLKVMSPSRK